MGACASAPAEVTPAQVASKQAPQALGTHAHRFEVIRDRFVNTDQVAQALRDAGLEASDLIVAIDLTQSNEWTGKLSFGGRCLHDTSAPDGMNPYTSVMSILCKTLAAFDEDEQIPMYGFGNQDTKNHSVACFDAQERPMHTLDNVLRAYNSQIASVRLSGPTSFAPAVRKGIEIVRASGGQFHILVIIADGQVSGGASMQKTVDAIVEASNYPLSIIMVGVGDGPWDQMQKFDDGLTARHWDNFQFVNFTELGKRAAARGYDAQRWEADFAVAALMEIPDQYATICKLGLLGNARTERKAEHVQVVPLVKVPSMYPASY